MSLPRHLSNIDFPSAPGAVPIDHTFACMAMCSLLGAGKLHDIMAVTNFNDWKDLQHPLFRSLYAGFLCLSNLKWRVAKVHDELDRVDAKLYIGLLEARAGSDMQTEFRDVSIPRYFIARLNKINAEKEAFDRQQVSLNERIAKVAGKIYASRTFPWSLKTIIFERDNYTCQRCLRNQELLRRLGLHLEVDHIRAVTDGGKTQLSNGETLCNECNNAKHHSKHFLRMVAAGSITQVHRRF